jgi:hypothetical protein
MAESVKSQIQSSFGGLFKQFDALVDRGAGDDALQEVINNSGLSEDDFLEVYDKYTRAGGIYEADALFKSLQGLTFNVADEIGAALPAGVMEGVTGETYGERLAQIRAGEKAYEAQSPYSAMGAEIGGALPYMMIPYARKKMMERQAAKYGPKIFDEAIPSLFRTVMETTGIGAAEGLASGLGRAEGGLGERTLPALGEAGLGAVAGGTFPLLTSGAQRIMSSGRDAETRAAEEISRLFPEAELPFGKTMEQAQQEVQRKIDVGETGEEIPETLADIGGETAARTLRGIRGSTPELDRAITVPLKTRTGVLQGERIERQIERAVGVSPDESTLINDVLKRQGDAADDAYDALRSQFPLVKTDDLLIHFDDPVFKQAYGEAVTAMKRRLKRGQITREELSAVPSYEDFMKGGYEVPFEFLERVKRRVSARADAAMAQSRDSDLKADIIEMKDAYVDDLDNITSGAYRDARNIYAGKMEISDALDAGREFNKLSAVDVKAKMDSFKTDSERRAFITGAMDYVRRDIEGTTDSTDLVTKLFGSKAKRRRLAALMGGEDSETFKSFVDYMKREADFVSTRRTATEGSQTAAYLQDIERNNIGFDEAAEMLLTGGVTTNPSMIGKMFGGLVSYFSRPPKDVSQKVTERLMDVSPVAQMRTLREAQAARDTARKVAANRAAAQQAVGIGAAQQTQFIPSLLFGED